MKSHCDVFGWDGHLKIWITLASNLSPDQAAEMGSNLVVVTPKHRCACVNYRPGKAEAKRRGLLA